MKATQLLIGRALLRNLLIGTLILLFILPPARKVVVQAFKIFSLEQIFTQELCVDLVLLWIAGTGKHRRQGLPGRVKAAGLRGSSQGRVCPPNHVNAALLSLNKNDKGAASELLLAFVSRLVFIQWAHWIFLKP